MRRLAIVSTHPIQYYSPLFRLMTERGNISIRVFYTWQKDSGIFDKDFSAEIKWDIPLLEGYDYRFVSNNGDHRTDFFRVKNPTLEREIEEWGADAVLFFGWNYYSHLRSMRHFKNKIPVLFRGDSNLLGERPGLKRMARRLFLRWVYRHVDTAFYVGINSKLYFRAHGLTESQLIFAPHAIDNDRFSDDAAYDEEVIKWKKELGFDTKDKILLFVGKLQARKEPLLLIETFLAINDPRWRLVFVGAGELEGPLKEAAKGKDRIHFLPFQNQSRMPVVYRLCDIFCLPSSVETWGLAVNEAMACGRPILVSSLCGCAADLVVNGINGYIFSLADKTDFSEKMAAMFDKSDLMKEWGDASASHIQSWSYKEIATIVENTIGE
jgi:glycosyltransferase involved in cell wall biosynthesis